MVAEGCRQGQSQRKPGGTQQAALFEQEGLLGNRSSPRHVWGQAGHSGQWVAVILAAQYPNRDVSRKR